MITAQDIEAAVAAQCDGPDVTVEQSRGSSASLPEVAMLVEAYDCAITEGEECLHASSQQRPTCLCIPLFQCALPEQDVAGGAVECEACHSPGQLSPATLRGPDFEST